MIPDPRAARSLRFSPSEGEFRKNGRRIALTRALRARRARSPEVAEFSCLAAARAACVSTWLGEVDGYHPSNDIRLPSRWERSAVSFEPRAGRVSPRQICFAETVAHEICVTTWLGETLLSLHNPGPAMRLALHARHHVALWVVPENLTDKLSDYHWNTLFV